MHEDAFVLFDLIFRILMQEKKLMPESREVQKFVPTGFANPSHNIQPYLTVQYLASQSRATVR